MKTFRNVLAIALLLCALAAFLSVGAWAEGIQVGFDKATIYPGDTCNMTVSDELGAGSYFDFSLPNGVAITAYNGCVDGVHSYSLAIDKNAVSGDIIVSEKNSTEIPNFTKRIEITPPVLEPSFRISAAAESYTIGSSSPIALSAVNKENMNGYTVIWEMQSSDGAAGGFNPGSGDNVSVGYYSAGTSVIKAYVEYGSGRIYAGNELRITVTSAPAPDPTLTLTPETMNLVSGKSEYIRADISNAPDGAYITWTSSGNVTVYPTTTTSGSSVTVTAKSGITTSETATVTATVEGTYISKTCTVTITPNGVKHINVTADDYYPKVGETITVTANIEYSTPGDQVNEWKFDSSILQCTEVKGNYVKFKALKAGYSKVTAVSGQAETYIDIEVGGGQTINHQITYGNYATFDGTNPLYFITNEYISNFKGVTVDGYALTNGNQCSATSSSDGHILVALNPAYLKLLSSANYHTIQIYSTVNQPATGYFRNYGTTQTIYGVRTGDDNNIALWVTLCVIGFAGAAGLIIAKRKDIFGKSK